MHGSFGRYEALKSRGGRFQVNANSLGGYYSKAVQQCAKKLSEAGMVDYIGSDTHSLRHTHALKQSYTKRAYRELFRKNRILNDRL